ncbi:MAG: uracil-DNA glycosylase [Christensenellales bacterium]|jgi:uracil-DNA glycosylase family 4
MKSQAFESLRHACEQALAPVGKRIVFGQGRLDADVVLIGEAPGAQEEEQGRPFVGKAGKNLDEFLLLSGMDRKALYITNVVKFRPTKTKGKSLSNRPPTNEEIQMCRPFLWRELRLVNPALVVTLGNVALKAVYGQTTRIGDVHGQYLQIPVEGQAYTLYALYHPASIIYNPSLREVYLQDLKGLACWGKYGL